MIVLFLFHYLLLSQIKCEDSLVAAMIHCLKRCIEVLIPKAPQDIRLKRYGAQGYIGLFLEEEEASWLREIMKNFSLEAKKIGKLEREREGGRERRKEGGVWRAG